MNSNRHLIVFVKNPEHGKVKTRIAATTGDEVALLIYNKLLQIVKSNLETTQGIQKYLYYSDRIDHFDLWPVDHYLKKVQINGNLGNKMGKAFDEIFNSEKQFKDNKVIIIGSDCPDITSEVILSAFGHLDTYDVVIGPTYDGGYYLLGMRGYFPFLFDGISWSTENVCEQTISAILQQNLSFTTLPKLHDIDTEKDWQNYLERLESSRY